MHWTTYIPQSELIRFTPCRLSESLPDLWCEKKSVLETLHLLSLSLKVPVASLGTHVFLSVNLRVLNSSLTSDSNRLTEFWVNSAALTDRSHRSAAKYLKYKCNLNPEVNLQMNDFGEWKWWRSRSAFKHSCSCALWQIVSSRLNSRLWASRTSVRLFSKRFVFTYKSSVEDCL